MQYKSPIPEPRIRQWWVRYGSHSYTLTAAQIRLQRAVKIFCFWSRIFSLLYCAGRRSFTWDFYVLILFVIIFIRDLKPSDDFRFAFSVFRTQVIFHGNLRRSRHLDRISSSPRMLDQAQPSETLYCVVTIEPWYNRFTSNPRYNKRFECSDSFTPITLNTRTL